MFHGTGITNGSRFVHHDKRCSAFIVEKQQLKDCFHQYIELKVHLLPKVSVTGSMPEKDFKSIKNQVHREAFYEYNALNNSLQ